MQDGSKISFGAKDKVRKLSEVTEDGLSVRFAFRNGVVRTALVPFGSSVLNQAALHGLNQKFGDSFAGVDDVEDCILTFDKLAESVVTKEEWTQARVSDGMAGTSELARALVKVTGQPVDAVKATLATLDKDQKAALRVQPEVLAAIAELRAAKPKKDGAVDGTSVLGLFKSAPADSDSDNDE
jgi:hypothetical protein